MGEKPYDSKQCGKTFSSHLGFQAHERTHTREKSHACKEYRKGFTCYQNFEVMKGVSLERSPMNIRSVGKPSCYQSFQTHERNPSG